MMTGCEGSEPFALRVLGDSMEPEFKEGDVIVVEPGATAENGAYVVALHADEYVFRRLVFRRGKCYLEPLNQRYSPTEIRLSMVKGRVVSKSNGRGRQIKSYL